MSWPTLVDSTCGQDQDQGYLSCLWVVASAPGHPDFLCNCPCGVTVLERDLKEHKDVLITDGANAHHLWLYTNYWHACAGMLCSPDDVVAACHGHHSHLPSPTDSTVANAANVRLLRDLPGPVILTGAPDFTSGSPWHQLRNPEGPSYSGVPSI